jgi:lysophospholipase L1-like esterase
VTQASQKIMQQYIDGGVIPAQLEGQAAVSKTYVDGQLAIRDTNISAAKNAANMAQASVDNHKTSPTAHPAQNITYSGEATGNNVKQALDGLDKRFDDLILAPGDSGPEVKDARGGYSVLGERLNASDAQLGIMTLEVSERMGQIKSSVLYEAALQNLDNHGKLPNCKSAIFNKHLKIAVVGDSITEGANNYSGDVWINRFIDKLKKSLPSVTIEFTNFALGGRNLSQFNDPNYKAVNPETSPAINFWRPWATVGKSWKDHIKDYAADITVFAFGMNEVQVIKTGYWYKTNLASAISYVKNTNMDIALVSTILPTQNKDVYGQSEIETQNVARITREYAIYNGYPLIDSNRLWRILLYGIDECNFYNKELNAIESINTETVYNFSSTLTFASANYPSSTLGCDLVFRKHENEYMLMRFRNDGTGNVIDLYSMAETGSGTEANLVRSWLGTQVVSVQADGAKITVNGDSFLFYEKLYDGSINMSNLSANLSSAYFINRISYAETPVYEESELLGDGSSPINGNGINHPNSLGHYLNYYMASEPLLNSLAVSPSLQDFNYSDFQDTTIKEGEYKIYTNSIIHPPVSGVVSGRVSVKNNGTNIWIEFRSWNSTDIYMLNYNSAAWSGWYKISSTAV